MSDSARLKGAAKIFRFFKVLGFSSVSIVDGKSVTKPTDLLFLVGSISLGTFIGVMSINKRKDFATSNSFIADTGNFMTNLASIVVAIISCNDQRILFKKQNMEHAD